MQAEKINQVLSKLVLTLTIVSLGLFGLFQVTYLG